METFQVGDRVTIMNVDKFHNGRTGKVIAMAANKRAARVELDTQVKCVFEWFPIKYLKK